MRERLAEDKLARAEGLLREQRLLSLASTPGTGSARFQGLYSRSV